MAPTGEEIRARLARFAAHWSLYDRSERGEAQTFLNELFECYGTRRRDVAEFEAPQEGRFLDLIWPEVCLFEMKAPSESTRLPRHREQALAYWRSSGDPERRIIAPPYVVLCAFHRFEVWQPGLYPSKPVTTFGIEELPDQYDSLLFLAGREPSFRGGQAALTRDAVDLITSLNVRLAERRAGGPDERRDFLLRCVWCMFAEDLGQIPEHRFSRVLEELIDQPRRSSADDLGRLFQLLDDPSPERPAHRRFAGVPHANGTLFQHPRALHLAADELELLLRAASGFDWRQVEPAIFGSLLEGTLGHHKQWELGAHYTHEAEIQKIVQPTIVEPWVERIENLDRHEEATRAQADLMAYVVLDPACGSGNFLYVAYRELRRIERRLREREAELRRAGGLREQTSLGLFFPLQNIRGIEIDEFAVSLARVTLWMGHKLAVDELDLPERTLPLVPLSGIQVNDALRAPWPRADAIIGNPPYHGSQNLRQIVGGDYVEWLKTAFGCGVQELSVYWFRKAADHLQPGGRAGLVATNSISQGRARAAGLNYIAGRGGVITDAVSRQKWPGEAVVNVSIVNWVQRPPEPPDRFRLDGDEVVGISTRLRESRLQAEEFGPLGPNRGRAFQGPIPAGNFYLQPAEAEELLARPEADYAEVVRPYLVGDDITEDPEHRPRRWIIDFGVRSLDDAMRHPRALQLVRERVKPARDKNNRKAYRDFWWRFAEPRPGLREALSGLSRYIAGNAQGKRFLFVWCEPNVCPSNLTNVFAFEDDYATGILTSSLHQEWAKAEASTLRIDLRYTPTTCFETFPWPEPDRDLRDHIGRIAAELSDRRRETCVANGFGLTALYNQIDDGAWRDIAGLHDELDIAVAEAYRFPRLAAEDPVEGRVLLAKLHQEIARGKVGYAPFGAR